MNNVIYAHRLHSSTVLPSQLNKNMLLGYANTLVHVVYGNLSASQVAASSGELENPRERDRCKCDCIMTTDNNKSCQSYCWGPYTTKTSQCITYCNVH